MNDDGFKRLSTDSISSIGFFEVGKIDANINALKTFAQQKGIPLYMVDKFIAYNQFNGLNNDKVDYHLYDKHGNIISNVIGAFNRFANSGYDRTKWEKEHGIDVPVWLREKREREKQALQSLK